MPESTRAWGLGLIILLAAPGCLRASSEVEHAPAEKSVAVAQPAPAIATPEPPRVPPKWPAAGAPLTFGQARFPWGFAKQRVYLDAGHGAEGNTGNRSVTCEDEESFTLRVAEDLARRLEATGHFEVRISRKEGQRVAYADRLTSAAKWGAHVLVSLHSDSRGTPRLWSPREGLECNRQDTTPGFSVLWSEEAELPLQAQRAELARALARNLSRVGFPPYDGVDYTGLYAADLAEPGVFVAREPTHRRIFVLRKPAIPSVIIETHHALDFEEAARWREERTLEAFGAAVTQGLVEALAPSLLDTPPREAAVDSASAP
ncbi:N-acetylmuramoyl-L-alanine amidase [Myxococcus stipitatus DSM 14675]|uniref:N-acetylmuramoyl-L-alanine amidase n=1 Tax=Myxococcus stipitatus (strain DSM 14675 / JCM 12634 / Mx s8) TaxID=1278073 RepID=L7UBF7_MYXSD|nr:N-acetylmuramoyl-L-alanine amidase [Myxococcus stipitatus]AGC45225.1 N-acetylmuramoyl-L-alanine amidase [Myxococcus stipitatus DSM 14675]